MDKQTLTLTCSCGNTETIVMKRKLKHGIEYTNAEHDCSKFEISAEHVCAEHDALWIKCNKCDLDLHFFA